MGCFSLAWLEQLLVWLVIVGAVFAILRLVIPLALSGWPPIIGQVLNIVLWAIIVILIIWICFALLSCLGGGLSLLPPMPHH